MIVWRLKTWGLERVLSRLRLYDGRAGGEPKEALETLTKYPFTQEEIDIILSNDAWVWLSGS